MAEKFDPYRKWLGIPPEEQPPHFYRLLGVGLFESDPDVISNAADRQMTHVRSYQTGKQSAASQKLLNELSNARVCLLDPAKRAAYDEKLRAEMAASRAVAQPVVPVVTAVGPKPPFVPGGPSVRPGPTPAGPVLPGPGLVTTGRTTPASTVVARKKSRSSPWPLIAIGGLVVAGVIGALVMLAGDKSGGKEKKRPSASETAEKGEKTSPVKTETPEQKSPAVARNDKPQEVRPRPASPPKQESRPQPSGNSLADAAMTSAASLPASDAAGELHRVEASSGAVRALDISPDGTQILTAGDDATVRLWNANDWSEVRRYEGPTKPVQTACFAAKGQALLAVSDKAGGDGCCLYVWLWGSSAVFKTHDLPAAQTILDVAPMGEKAVFALACRDKSARIFAQSEDKMLATLREHTGPVRRVAITPDGKTLLTGSEDHAIGVWTLETQQLVRKLRGHTQAVTALALSTDGKLAVSGGEDRTIVVWDLAAGKAKRRLGDQEGAVLALTLSRDEKYFLSGGEGGVIHLWSVQSKKQIRQYAGHDGPVYDLAFSPNGRTIYSAGADHTVRAWSVPDLSGQLAADEADEPPIREPVPEEATLKKSLATIRGELFKDQFADLDTPSKKLSLAKQLVEKSRVLDDDSSAIYALMKTATDLNVEGRDCDAAFASIDALADWYEVDALKLKVAAVEGIADSKPTIPPATKVVVAQRALGLIDAVIAAGDAEAAERLLVMVRALTRGGKEGNLKEAIAAKAGPVENLKAAYTEYQKAAKTLESKPGDPAANEQAGRYLCFRADRWTDGLPLLAKGADATLKKLAAKELAHPKEAEEQLALANGWWTVAEKEKEPASERVKKHAAGFYQQAEPGLTSLQRDVARTRMREAGLTTGPQKESAAGGAASEDAATSVALPATEGLECRREPKRSILLQGLGGSDETEAAVEKAVKWIVEQQLRDGSWNFAALNPRRKNPLPDAGSLEQAPNAATALALLAILGAGDTPKTAKYRGDVAQGLEALRSRLTMVGPKAASLYERNAGPIPSHALGTMALCESLLEHREKKARAAADLAVGWLVATQNKDGGWSQRPSTTQTPEPSQAWMTVWNAQALQVADWSGVKVPADSLHHVEKYFESLHLATRPGYHDMPANPRAEARKKDDEPGMDGRLTAAILSTRLMLGADPKGTDFAELLPQAVHHGPNREGDWPMNYWLTCGLRQHGGDLWRNWNGQLREYLLSTQVAEGDEAGSWPMRAESGPGRQWGHPGGRLLSTAMAATLLESYYRYPLKQ